MVDLDATATKACFDLSSAAMGANVAITRGANTYNS